MLGLRKEKEERKKRGRKEGRNGETDGSINVGRGLIVRVSQHGDDADQDGFHSVNR